MNYIPEFRKLLDFIERSLRNTKLVTDDPRLKVAATLLNVALDHAQGICVLLEKGIYPPAMALQRVLFETYIRAMWFEKCASQKQLDDFITKDQIKMHQNKDIPFSNLVKDVEKAIEAKNLFSEVKENVWKVLNSSTHGGMQQVDKYYDGRDIQHTYNQEIKNEMARLAALFASMSFSAILDITKNPASDSLAEQLLTLVRVWAFGKSNQQMPPAGTR